MELVLWRSALHCLKYQHPIQVPGPVPATSLPVQLPTNALESNQKTAQDGRPGHSRWLWSGPALAAVANGGSIFVPAFSSLSNSLFQLNKYILKKYFHSRRVMVSHLRIQKLIFTEKTVSLTSHWIYGLKPQTDQPQIMTYK